MTIPDLNLRKYSMSKEWQYYCAYIEHGSYTKAANSLSVHRSTISRAVDNLKKKAALRGYSPEHGFHHEIPEGHKLKGVSKYFKETNTWVKTERDKLSAEEISKKVIESLSNEIPSCEAVNLPINCEENLITVYPVGDHHLGMLSWEEETGDDYDLKISSKILISACSYLVDRSPNSHTGVIMLLGDFLHFDGMIAQTPTSKHPLDTDSRFPKIIEEAINMIRFCVHKALSKHEKVVLIIEVGNHDPASSLWLRKCLQIHYENEPRIFVDTSPKNIHALQFGNVMIGCTHGDKVKFDNIAPVMSSEFAEIWGRTKHRHFYCGHLHHDRTKDVTGAKIEQVRVLPPSDAHSSSHGWKAGRDMKSATFHKEYGKISEFIFSADMLE